MPRKTNTEVIQELQTFVGSLTEQTRNLDGELEWVYRVQEAIRERLDAVQHDFREKGNSLQQDLVDRMHANEQRLLDKIHEVSRDVTVLQEFKQRRDEKDRRQWLRPRRSNIKLQKYLDDLPRQAYGVDR